MDQKTKKNFRFFLISVAASILIYTLLVFWSGAPEILDAVKRITGFQLLGILILSLTGFLIRFGRWYWYLHHLDHNLPLLQSLRIYFSGLLFVLTPARAGEAVRSVYLRKYEVPYANSLWVMFLEQVNDIAGMLILSCLIMSLFTNSILFIISVGLLVILVAMSATHSTTILKFIRQHRPISAMPKILNLITKAEQTAEGATKLFNIKLQLVGLTVTVCAFALQGLSFYLVTRFLGLDITPWTGIGIYAFSLSIGSFSFLPGGLGSTEAIMIGLLSLAGAAMPDAVAITILGRATNLWFGVSLGALATLSLGLSHRKNGLPVFSL